MIETAPLAAPDLKLSASPSKFQREKAAFARLKPQLLNQYRGRFVAIHNETVVASGTEIVPVALEAYQKIGYVPIFVDLVTDEIQPPVRTPSFRDLSPS